MNYIIESIFVGIYVYFIYLVFSPFIKNIYILLLVCGFCKHFFGSSLGLWTWYCNNGEACIKILDKNNWYKSNTFNLIKYSIYESIIFLVFGIILNMIILKKYLFLILGILLHIISEQIGIHTKFCKNNCDKNNSKK